MQEKVYNHSYLKNINRLNILECVYTNEDVNRNYISLKTGLTGAAVTKIINSLIQDKFLTETTYFSEKRKRKARYLKLSEKEYGVVVIHVSRGQVSAAILELNGNIVVSDEYGYNYHLMDDKLFIEIIDTIMKKFPDSMKCLGCVFITPGIVVSYKKERKNQTPYYWDFDTLKNYIKENYSIDVICGNDSNIALLGERWFGKAKKEKNSVLYNIGKGIGAAAFVNDKLLEGYNNSSIEIGHTTIDFQGPQCSCGNKGCLELYIGEENWEKRLRNKETYKEVPNLVETLFFKASQNDQTALKEITEYANLVSNGAITLANMFSPSTIILTTNGADYYNLDLLVSIIEKEINKSLYTKKLGGEPIKVVASSLRSKGYLLGGLVVALLANF